MSDPTPFRFSLLTRVPLGERGEGVIVERSQRTGSGTKPDRHETNHAYPVFTHDH